MHAFKVWACFLVISSIIPFTKTQHWTLRIFDFPRFQCLILAWTSLVLAQIFFNLETVYLALLGSAITFDTWRVLPYTKLATQHKTTQQLDATKKLKVFVANVYINNQDKSSLITLIEKNNPDIGFLVETDEKWISEVKLKIKEKFPFIIEQPKSNTYGFLFFSKFPIAKSQTKTLGDNKVPHLDLQIQTPWSMVQIYGMHPRPPRPSENGTKERNKELASIALTIRKNFDMPTIVMGDLNDVAWSHTTRLFKRVAELIDPRVGVGAIHTWHAKIALLRFPLDHIFHSKHFYTNKIYRGPNFGSDHFPICAELNFAEKEPLEKPKTSNSFTLVRNPLKQDKRCSEKDLKEAEKYASQTWQTPKESLQKADE